MNKLFIYTLKLFQKVYAKPFINQEKPICIQDPDKASQIIYDALMSEKPCMIARFGFNEINVLTNYQSVKGKSRSIINNIKGAQFDWWWNDGVIKGFANNAGFFPPTIDKIEQFCELTLQDIPEVNVLGSWLPLELNFAQELKNAQKVWLLNLEPFWVSVPWTNALERKKVLVIHPFAQTIESQYEKRNLIFPNNLLPEFELSTLKAVQSIAGEKTPFADWFEALDYMKAEIDKRDYDICLIGCGAYGFSLAAHVKRMGKKSFHLGGSLQLLFGIRGKRWETEPYKTDFNYGTLINEYWVRPDETERPKESNNVEGACYW